MRRSGNKSQTLCSLPHAVQAFTHDHNDDFIALYLVSLYSLLPLTSQSRIHIHASRIVEIDVAFDKTKYVLQDIVAILYAN